MPYYMHTNEMVTNEFNRFIAQRMTDTHQSMSFLNECYTDLFSWKDLARKYVFERILYESRDYNYSERIVEEEDFCEYTRQKLYFRYRDEYEIPAYYLLPKNAKKPLPAAVVLHDHGGYLYHGKEKSVEHKNACPTLLDHLQEAYEGQPVGSALAKRGYAVIVIDALMFGERRFFMEKSPYFSKKFAMYQTDTMQSANTLYPLDDDEFIQAYNAMIYDAEPEFVRMMDNAGLSSMGIRLADDIASVGYLAQRSEVDANRICCVGLSMGGFRSGWLSAMDDRIKCSVLVGWMAQLSDMMKNRPGNYAPMWTLSGVYGHLDYPDIVSLAAPKPLMIMHCLQDWLFTHEEDDGKMNKTGEKAIDIVKKVYHKAGHIENLDVRIYDLPHVFNKQMQEEAYTWLDAQLK